MPRRPARPRPAPPRPAPPHPSAPSLSSPHPSSPRSVPLPDTQEEAAARGDSGTSAPGSAAAPQGPSAPVLPHSSRASTIEPSSPRTIEPSAARTTSLAAGAARGQEPQEESGRIVQAADRFRDLLRPRPWRRHRRRALMIGGGVLLLLASLLIAAVMLPQLQVAHVDVEGTGYVSADDVREAASAGATGSVLLLPTGAIAADVRGVPGVREAAVERAWPDGVRITVTEREPLAQLTDASGQVSILDADGVTLPAAAGAAPEGGEAPALVPMAIGEGSQDPAAAQEAMLSVLAELPLELRSRISGIQASTLSDVTFTLSPERGGAKTIIWGDASDAALKAEVVQALLDRPGSVIDVTSPVAPVTR